LYAVRGIIKDESNVSLPVAYRQSCDGHFTISGKKFRHKENSRTAMATEDEPKILEGKVGDELNIEFDEVILPGQTLGQHDATEGGVLAGKKIKSAKISSISRKIAWGSFEGRPACVLGIELYFQSDEHVLKRGSFKLQIVSTSTLSSFSSSIPHFRPEIYEGKPSQKDVNKSFGLNPSVSVGGVQVSGVNTSRDTSYTQERVWSITGIPMANGDDDPLCKGVEWKIHEDTIQRTGVKHHLRVAVLILHSGNPFVLEFKADGKTGIWGEKPKWLLSKSEAKPVLRIFHPESSSNILMLGDLNGFVGEVLIA
jgi:hypothetical protein